MKGKLIKHKDGFKREDKTHKVDYTLIPTDVLEALAKHYTDGAVRHGVDNWKKAIDLDSFKQGAFRHLIAILNRENNEDHYSALCWNVMCLKWNELNGKK